MTWIGMIQIQDSYLLEDARYVGAPFNQLQFKKIRLPDGKGNIIYLFSDTFFNCVKMVNSKYFSYPASYRKLFYPQILSGTMLKRRFRYRVVDKQDRSSLITEKTKSTIDLKKKFYDLPGGGEI